MKALTLTHPWPWAFVELSEGEAKRVENRTWEPPRGLIGQYIALHGGKVPTGAKLTEAREDALYIHNTILEDETGDPDMTAEDLDDDKMRRLCIPGIFAVARLARVVISSSSPWFFGPFGWELDKLVRIDPPVPHVGKQGLWEVEEEAIKLVRERYKAGKGPAPTVAPTAVVGVDMATGPDATVITTSDGKLTPADRETCIDHILTVAGQRNPYWATTGYDGRRAGLEALADAELLRELERYA